MTKTRSSRVSFTKLHQNIESFQGTAKRLFFHWTRNRENQLWRRGGATGTSARDALDENSWLLIRILV